VKKTSLFLIGKVAKTGFQTLQLHWLRLWTKNKRFRRQCIEKDVQTIISTH